MNVTFDESRLQLAKRERNSGRTFDSLVKAVQATKQHPCVVFIVSSRGEAKRLESDVRLICEHYGYAISRIRCRTDFEIDGNELLVWSGSSFGCGCRAHIILDHSCREELSAEQYQCLLASVCGMDDDFEPIS